MEQLTVGLIAGAAVGAAIALIVQKMGKDLIPKKRIFTPRGTIIGLSVIIGSSAIFQLIRLSMSDEPISAALAQMFLATMLTMALVAASIIAMCLRLSWRVTLIEKHCGLSVRE